MSIASRLLSSGPGWSVQDVICTAGPSDRPFEERHGSVCIAAVTRGTFQYRSPQGAATLVPGAIMLGEPEACFECGHEHGVGDRCLSFQFDPAYFEEIVAAVRGVRSSAFGLPRLPPSQPLLRFVATAEAAGDHAEALEEVALALAGAVLATLATGGRTAAAPSRRDERRVTDAVRRIESEPHEPVTLSALARDAAMSPYHFLRTFQAVAGMTPYQFLLAERMRAAAIRLRDSEESVSAIAFDSGFNDLSTFNHRFRRVMGMTPSAWRRARP